MSQNSSFKYLLLTIDAIIAARCFYKILEYRWKYKYIPREEPKKQIRVWVDGVFDMMHFGHANMLRQGSYFFKKKNQENKFLNFYFSF